MKQYRQDKALHSTTLPAYILCSCNEIKAFNDKSCGCNQVNLPCKVPHSNVRLTKLLIFLAHGLDCISLAGKSPASARLERCYILSQLSQRRVLQQCLPFITILRLTQRAQPLETRHPISATTTLVQAAPILSMSMVGYS